MKGAFGAGRAACQSLLVQRLIALAALVPGSVGAQTNLLEARDIPALKPPRAELPPTFWEQHGVALASGIGGFLVLLGALLLWYLLRSKPVVLIAPASEARRALESLRSQPETGPMLSRVSQVVRQYATTVFKLAPGQLTTAEWCRALESCEKAGPELAGEFGGFMRRCDDYKFKPANLAPSEPLRAVDTALRLIELAEARLAQQRSEPVHAR